MPFKTNPCVKDFNLEITTIIVAFQGQVTNICKVQKYFKIIFGKLSDPLVDTSKLKVKV